MAINLFRRIGLRNPAPDIELRDNSEDIIALPDDHPCRGCRVLDMHTGVPYCFLPQCNWEVFNVNTQLETPQKKDSDIEMGGLI